MQTLVQRRPPLAVRNSCPFSFSTACSSQGASSQSKIMEKTTVLKVFQFRGNGDRQRSGRRINKRAENHWRDWRGGRDIRGGVGAVK